MTFALTALAVGCGHKRAQAPVARTVVFITIDTLRADRLGCYGNPNVATPNMDRLAREGAMAPAASVQVPLTRPSHTTIFTGLYPAQHGIRDNVSPSLAKDVPTLAEVLRRAGFHTAGFVSSIVLSAQSGLNRGFDTYSDQFDIGRDDARFLNTIQKRGDITTSEATGWLRQHAGERVFVWLHLYDPHDPYEPPEPFASTYRDRPYDGEVAWSDVLVGRVDQALGEAGIRDNTLFVVTSDHGEGLGEHGESVHGFFVYDTTLRVPLLIRGPGVEPGLRLEADARSIDLFPTLLDLAGVPQPAGPRPGRTLAEALRGRARLSDEPSFAESLVPKIHYGWSDLHAITDGRWKYILAPRPELYDTQADPREEHNLAGAEAAKARALRAGLEQHVRDEQATARATTTTAPVPAELVEKLGALGYVAAGPPQDSKSAGADPKDKIGEYRTLNRLMREGILALRTKDYGLSIRRFTELHGQGVDSFEVHYYLARALVGLARWKEAEAQFTRAIEKLPQYGAAYLALAECRIASKNFKGAIGALRDGEAVNPADARLVEMEAETWRRLGGKREAIHAYEREVVLMPNDALVRVRLGELYRDVGEPKKAIDRLREAVRLDPSEASYWNALGMVLGGGGDLGGAEAAFREAIARDASDPQYVYNLGLAIERQGRGPEASRFYRKALDLDPSFRPARDRLAEVGAR